MPVHLSRREIEEALDPQTVRVFQLLYVALTAGVLIVLGMVLVRHLGLGPEGKPTAGSVSLIRTLSGVNGLGVLLAYGLGQIFFRRNIRAAQSEPDKNASSLIEALRSAIVLRLAIAEGSALLGLAVCFLGTADGTLREFPDYWWNLLSPAAFLALVIFTFPTRSKLADVLTRPAD